MCRRLTIYDTNGALVRRLDVGLSVGRGFTTESVAAQSYWDGRNAVR